MIAEMDCGMYRDRVDMGVHCLSLHETLSYILTGFKTDIPAPVIFFYRTD